uniref:C2H2-type domain-containing protein n=1 Tax=Strongyloides stercoralis TaxID=6248 RepID=A0A0K0EJM2_STRER
MASMRCPPTKHEYIFKYKHKRYFGRYKNIQKFLKENGIESTIIHYPYKCNINGCNLRFMFHIDMVDHHYLHHNIECSDVKVLNFNMPTRKYSIENRKKDGFFTMDELMNFTEEDFEKHNVILKKIKKLPLSCVNSFRPSIKKKLICKKNNLGDYLQEFISENDYQNCDTLNELEMRVLTYQKIKNSSNSPSKKLYNKDNKMKKKKKQL